MKRFLRPSEAVTNRMEIRTLTDQIIVNSPLEELVRFQLAISAEIAHWEAQVRQ